MEDSKLKIDLKTEVAIRVATKKTELIRYLYDVRISPGGPRKYSLEHIYMIMARKYGRYSHRHVMKQQILNAIGEYKNNPNSDVDLNYHLRIEDRYEQEKIRRRSRDLERENAQLRRKLTFAEMGT